jgi:hypothetical protein
MYVRQHGFVETSAKVGIGIEGSVNANIQSVIESVKDIGLKPS